MIGCSNTFPPSSGAVKCCVTLQPLLQAISMNTTINQQALQVEYSLLSMRTKFDGDQSRPASYSSNNTT